MALSGPASVSIGETFTIDINADPPPDVPVTGLSSEIVLPGGLSWVQRASCQEERQVTFMGGPPPICDRTEGPGGEARHFVGAGQGPPLPVAALDEPLGALIELDVQCSEPGAHMIVLTAETLDSSGSPYGGAYRAGGSLILLGTIPFDIDGDTVAERVADTLEIECLAQKPGLDPTPTRVSELVDPPAVVTPTATDFSEVSPALATPQGTALGDVLSPDAGDGPGDDGGAPLAALGALALALVLVVYGAVRRAGG
jgi:hypothetical protein